MNHDEYLLVLIIEECTEIAHEASKALRFGMYEVMPGQERSNRERILLELNDLWAVVELANLQNVDRDAIERKKVKVGKFMEYSETCGTLVGAEVKT